MEERKLADINKIVSTVRKYLSRSGRNVAYLDYAETKIQEYLAWYRGSTSWHKYKVHTGRKVPIHKTRASLDLAKTACEDMASLLLNEKVDIKLSDSESQSVVDRVLRDNNFKVEGNRLIELICALGTGSINNGWDADKKRQVMDFVHGDMIFPISWENGIITECAFGTIGKENTNIFYTLYIHEIGIDGNYVIKTVNLDTDSNVVKPLEIADRIASKCSADEYSEIIYTGSSIPFFNIIKTNIVNNYDKTNPLGMSIFGNAIDILKSIDMEYDSWHNEFETGRRKLFVKSGLKVIEVATDSENLIDPIDRNDTTYHLLDWEKDDVPIHEFSPNLRTEAHVSSLNTQLKFFSRKVGLGDGFYAFENGGLNKTATEIISTNSSLFRNLKKFELILEQALVGMCRAILTIENLFNGGKYDVWQDITINFDDSIIEDTEKEKQQAMAEYNAGLIDRVEYFVLTRNLTREQAEKLVAEMDATDTMKVTLDFMNNGGTRDFNEE
jgi:A118 family predicted phage portal protein